MKIKKNGYYMPNLKYNTMENTEKWNVANDNIATQKNWQQAENEENRLHSGDPENLDFKSAEANGYGTDSEENQKRYATDNDPGDKDDEKEDNEEDAKSDWGDVDPQDHPGLPSDMDPSGPGSAV